MNITSASSWDTNPVVAAWRRSVESAGGRALPTGYPSGADAGGPTAVYLIDESKGWAAGGNRRYELAPSSVRLAVGWERAKDAATQAAGAVAEKAEGIVKATGLDKGIFGVIGKALGVPAGLLVATALLAGVVIGYAALVNIGAVPSIRELRKR